MYGKESAAVQATSAFAIGVAAISRHSASAELLLSPMNSEINSVLQLRLPVVFTALLEELLTLFKPDLSEEQQNIDEVRHLLVMPETELFGNGHYYRAAGSIDRLLFGTRRFT